MHCLSIVPAAAVNGRAYGVPVKFRLPSGGIAQVVFELRASLFSLSALTQMESVEQCAPDPFQDAQNASPKSPGTVEFVSSRV